MKLLYVLWNKWVEHFQSFLSFSFSVATAIMEGKDRSIATCAPEYIFLSHYCLKLSWIIKGQATSYEKKVMAPNIKGVSVQFSEFNQQCKCVYVCLYNFKYFFTCVYPL